MCVKTSGNPLLRGSVWSWDIAQLAQYLFKKDKALGSSPITTYNWHGGTCHDPNSQEIEAGRSKVQVILSFIVNSRLTVEREEVVSYPPGECLG